MSIISKGYSKSKDLEKSVYLSEYLSDNVQRIN